MAKARCEHGVLWYRECLEHGLDPERILVMIEDDKRLTGSVGGVVKWSMLKATAAKIIQ